jgi:PAS domain S-box-containing protein
VKEGRKKESKRGKPLNGSHDDLRTTRNPIPLSEDEIRRYLTHFSLANDVLYSVDLQFRLVSVSPSVENSLGYKPEELIGKTLPELGVLHPEDLEKAVEDTAKLLAGKKISPSIYRFITREGKVRFGETRSAPFVRNGRIETVIAVARDVTKTVEMEQELSKHRAHLEDLVRERTADLLRANEQLQQEMERRTAFEKALQESEAKYRYLTEKMNDIIWTADLDLRITYDSPSVEKVLGYTPQERQNQTVRDTLTPDSYARAVQALAAEIERDGQEGVDPDRSVKMELEYYHKNGSIVWLEMVGSAIRDNNGRIVGIHGVSRDITDRKKAEEELGRYRERLEELVRERTSELTRVNERLKREIEEKTSTAVALRSRESDLLQSRRYLEEMNAALKVLLKQRDEDKASMRQNIISNLELNAIPYLDKMESTHLTDLQRAYLAKIRASLSDITSPFTRKISNEYLNLTPSEIQVAGFIKEGKSSKEIASLMNLSHNTIQTHRYNIRIKLGLQNSKESLRSHLISLE